VATVHLPLSLARYTGGLETLALEAPRVHDLLAALTDRFPDLAGPIQEMAVAVDGEIYQEAGYQPLRPDSEVHLIPRIAGG
jgi:hypothetical protein